MTHALIPLKRLTEAKTRLAGLLQSSDRQALALAMVEDVLAVLSAHNDIDSITVVSDDPVAPLLANRYGARCWQERDLGCTGLNAVIAAASQRLLLLLLNMLSNMVPDFVAKHESEFIFVPSVADHWDCKHNDRLIVVAVRLISIPNFSLTVVSYVDVAFEGWLAFHLLPAKLLRNRHNSRHDTNELLGGLLSGFGRPTSRS